MQADSDIFSRNRQARLKRYHKTRQQLLRKSAARTIADSGPLEISHPESKEVSQGFDRKQLQVGLFKSSWEGRILECNLAFARIFGYETVRDILQVPAGKLFLNPDGRASLLKRMLTHRKLVNYEIQGQRQDGSEVWLLENSLLLELPEGRLAIEGSVVDISTRKSQEQELIDARTLEAIRQLAGGVAHDLNNMLMAILGYSRLALDRVGPQDPVDSDLQEILRAGDRAADITSQLLAFSRQQILKPERLNLNEVLVGLEPALQRMGTNKIQFDHDLEPSLALTEVDPEKLRQVIANLVSNACDALPDGGSIFLKTCNLFLKAPRTVAQLPAGSYVTLCIQDDGVGMREETVQRIFEPFYTTKEVGKGTGLGLAAAYGILKQSGGHISVTSQPGKGSCFTIYLPTASRREWRISRPVELPGPNSESNAHGSELYQTCQADLDPSTESPWAADIPSAPQLPSASESSEGI